MFTKYVIFAFLAVFALQGVVETTSVSQPIERNVFNDLGKLIQKLKNYIANAIQAAVEKVKNLFANLENAVKKLIENAKSQLEEELVKVFDVINNLKEEANGLGIDVSECTELHQNEIATFKEKVMGEIVDCASKEIATAEGMIDTIVSEINAIISSVSSIQDKAKHCGINVICYASLIKEAYKLFADLPGKIQQLVADASSLSVNIESKVPVCISEKIFVFIEETKPVVNVISECISEKIGKLYY